MFVSNGGFLFWRHVGNFSSLTSGRTEHSSLEALSSVDESWACFCLFGLRELPVFCTEEKKTLVAIAR